MKSKDYIIELNKIKAGDNFYEFVINDAFLANHEYSPIKQANIKVEAKLVKRNLLMELTFEFKGTAHVECDTCLNEIEYPIDTDYELIIKQAEESNFTDDEIVYLGKNEIELDLSQFLYESFILSIPQKKSCNDLPEPTTCDGDILDKLNNQVFEQPEEDVIKEHEADPQWEKLKNIIKNN